jgi:hypothetical protein
MLITPKFEYPEIQQVTLDSGFRYYVCPYTGGKMASVTTILDATSDKSGLIAWRERIGNKRADQESEYACAVGSLMHEHVEAFIESRERPTAFTPTRILAKNMADKIITEGLPHVSEVWAVEARLFISGLFAGTVDLIGMYKDHITIIDHKSAKKMKKKDQIKDYVDQMSAYILSHNSTYGTNIQHATVFMSTRTGEFKAIEFSPEEIRIGQESFLDRVKAFYDSGITFPEN